MTVAPQRSWAGQVIQFWLGLLIFAVIGFVGFFLGSGIAAGDQTRQVMAALLTALVTAIPAIWLLLRRQIALGSGLLVGYAIATVASGGQCTFLAAPSNYGYGFLNGFAVYIIAIVVVLIGAPFVAGIEVMRKRR